MLYYYDVLSDYSLGLIGTTPPKDLNECTRHNRYYGTCYFNEYSELVYLSTIRADLDGLDMC
jgi:hypothetical protein